ncbi:TetR/AcrR family transcriptional regulator [Amycolatopsis nigrescens]|uniref:TetR/AcrR family transcriptional regulator n=1 Tax=Amycolatopsis nigrescens TaxID=381445 RepID=UPI0003687A77|nr:TetR/AcrR family transcriptional regulator [Amycolatopsis nigrescens]
MAKAQVSREDWVRAAIDALIEGGVAAVRVDTLARRVGITRGSFYWHFADRDELLAAALADWERLCTTEVIDSVQPVADPEQRLGTLLAHALGSDARSRLEPALMAHAGHPVVAPVLRRVTERRMEYLTRCYRDLGLGKAAARRRAVVAYATYVGWLELRRAVPDVLPELTGDDRSAKAVLAHLNDVLVSVTHERPV